MHQKLPVLFYNSNTPESFYENRLDCAAFRKLMRQQPLFENEVGLTQNNSTQKAESLMSS